jgi:effector-binding domain-containing protein
VFDAAIPLASMPAGLPEEGIVKLGETPSGQALKAVHKGPYSTMHETYEKLRAKIREKGLKEGPRFWEEYVTDPGETDEAELLTNIYILVE